MMNGKSSTSHLQSLVNVHLQSSLPVCAITESNSANTGNLTTANDLPGLETHSETRLCGSCNSDTMHRVGTQTQLVDRPTYTQTKVSEYSHCSVCGNTGTIITKATVMKVGE